MTKSDVKFWPLRPLISFLSTIALLVLLVLILIILRSYIDWPSTKSESVVLIGVMVFSLLPVLLALVNVIIERGGVIEYGGVKIDFSRLPQTGLAGITVPVNIAVRGEPIYDSRTTEILDALKRASSCDVIIIDLEEGDAWWETRLLVLLAGAARLRKPDKVVFVGTDAGKKQTFQGWAHPEDLLRPLSEAHPQYLHSLKAAQAAAKQWELVEPVNPIIPNAPAVLPVRPPWIQGGLAASYEWMAFDKSTSLPNELLAEQILASELGLKVEAQTEPKRINLVRLDDLFRPVLKKSLIDQSWSNDRQINAFFDNDEPFIAVTQKGKYSTIISRLTVLSEMLRSILLQKEN